jgi:hypothetical protein
MTWRLVEFVLLVTENDFRLAQATEHAVPAGKTIEQALVICRPPASAETRFAVKEFPDSCRQGIRHIGIGVRFELAGIEG